MVAGQAMPHEVLPSPPSDIVEVGRILGAWGVRGGVKVQPFAADPQALQAARVWRLLPPASSGPVPDLPGRPWPTELHIIGVRHQGGCVVASVRGVSDRDAAQALRGARVFVARAQFPRASEGEYYCVDLIGLPVVNREGVDLGTVVGLMETGAHDVLRVVERSGPSPVERLIPFVEAFVDAVDLDGRRIVVDWGLDY